ncbi:RNA polymerase sigma factor [Comamonas flocculans]|nr:RNA polymerase sigma factor [Comamonas flocculans]
MNRSGNDQEDHRAPAHAQTAPGPSTMEETPAPDTANRDLLFRDLVRAHWSRLHRFIIKNIGHCDDAEDLTQQAFAEAVRSYERFRGQSELSTWLYGIAMNLVRNHLSRAPQRRFDFVGEEALDAMACEAPSPSAALVQSQQLHALQLAMQELPEHMREVLLLVAVDELSYEDAAALLTVPVGTVRSRISRARGELRSRMRLAGVELDF